jgi:hypothetical protein
LGSWPSSPCGLHEHDGAGPAFAPEDLAGQQGLHHEPLVKRGEMDQGIGLLAYQSLIRVAKGFLLGALIATPLGFLLGLSKAFNRMFDPVDPGASADFTTGMAAAGTDCVSEIGTGGAVHHRALLDVADRDQYDGGVKAIPQEYWNVQRFSGLQDSRRLPRFCFRHACRTCSRVIG